MKRMISILLVFALAVSVPAFAQESDPADAPRAITAMLYDGEFQQVYDQSTPDMQAALGSVDGLAAIWAQIGQKYGAFAEITGATAAEQGGYLVSQVTCEHASAILTFNVVLDADGKLAGLTVLSVDEKVAQSTADQTQFVTEEITLRAGAADETQGILTLPAGEGPFPAVIMMQGSGPSDMNEAAFGIAVFRDLVEGLAAAGVASIRYDKYTYAHADLLQADPDLLAHLTVQEEYLLDAQAALQLLKTDGRIGAIYLLGHSLGGMILPRVMQTLGAENFNGGVILAGSPLPLWEIQYHQNLTLIPALPETDQAAAQAAIDAEAAKVETLSVLTDEELLSTKFFGLSAYYQLDLISVDTAQTAATLGKPLLIVQGGKDWQVTPADGIDAWQAALSGMTDVTYKLYPDMNHMLVDMTGEPAGDTSDYIAGSIASATLIADITAWILGE